MQPQNIWKAVKERNQKGLEKRKDDKFGELLSGKLEWLKCTLQKGKRFRMRPEKLAGKNHAEAWKPY